MKDVRSVEDGLATEEQERVIHEHAANGTTNGPEDWAPEPVLAIEGDTLEARRTGRC